MWESHICSVQFDMARSTVIVGGDNREVYYLMGKMSKYMIASCTTDIIDSRPVVKVWSTAIPPDLDAFNVEHASSNTGGTDMPVIAPIVIFTQSAVWTLLWVTRLEWPAMVVIINLWLVFIPPLLVLNLESHARVLQNVSLCESKPFRASHFVPVVMDICINCHWNSSKSALSVTEFQDCQHPMVRLDSIQPSIPSIPENISSSPMFPWSQNPFTNGPPGQQQLGSNLPIILSQQGVNPYVNPRVLHNMPQPIHVRLQTPLGDSHMQSGPQYPPYHEVTKGGLVSKKRKTSASRKGVVRANLAHADSKTSERTSIMETAPSQACHPFPDWLIMDYARIPASRNMSLDPSGPSVATRLAGSGTSVSGSPANFSFTPFLKFFMESVNHLVSTFESNQLSVQCMMKEQQQQFSSHLELLHAKIAQTSPAAPPGQPTPSSFLGDVEGGDDLPIPPKKKQTKCHFLKNSQAVDGEVDMATYV
ncbi:hypothetical protein EDD16DRAFT_1527234 [Pisolithus croceorrhizus]|nr:hypothetical protein EDD16DRAFT_1527234 [Pisolithus croceorrhizus]